MWCPKCRKEARNVAWEKNSISYYVCDNCNSAFALVKPEYLKKLQEEERVPSGN